MNVNSLPALLMGAVCLYVGFYHLYFYSKQGTGREGLAFSAASISIALFDFFSAGLYSAQSISEGGFWMRYQLAAIALFSIAILWFVVLYIGDKNKKIVIFFSVVYTLFFILGIILPTKMVYPWPDPPVKHIVFGNIVNIAYYEPAPGPLYVAQYFLMMAGFVYILLKLGNHINKSEGKSLRPLYYALVFFFFASLNDIFVNSGLYVFFYLLEYSYLLIVLSMDYVLLKRFVNLFNRTGFMNQSLEEKFEKRTEELVSTMARLESLNDKLVKTSDALWGEMELAKKIQTTLLSSNPRLMGCKISVYMQPSDETGGDYYDVMNIGGRDWLVIGDVFARGIRAGLIMLMVRTAIQVFLERDPRGNPSALIALVNKIVYQNVNDYYEKESLNLMAFTRYPDGKFVYSGLHQNILVYRKETQNVESIETKGVPLGMEEDISEALKDEEVFLEIGDSMLLFTDGYYKAENKNGEHFGMEHLMGLFAELGKKSPAEVKSGILSSLQGCRFADDLTLIIVKRVS